MHRPIRILGIDPGLRRTGWGVIAIEGNRLSFIACGSVATNDKASLAERLVAIHDGLRRVVADHAPTRRRSRRLSSTRMRPPRSSSGRRAASRCWCRRRGMPVAEYAPNLVKKTIVGAGHGEKAQIRMMIGVLLPKADPQTDDAADALAIAVCHAHHRQSVVLKIAAG